MGSVINSGVYSSRDLTLVHLVLDRSVDAVIDHQWIVGLHGGLAHVLYADHAQRVHEVLFLEWLVVGLWVMEILLHVEVLLLVGVLAAIRKVSVALRVDEVTTLASILSLVSLLGVCY